MCSKPAYRVPDRELSDYPDLYAGAQFAYLHTSQVLKPNISCAYHTMGKFCRNKHCLKHGQDERKRQAKRRYYYEPSVWDTYFCNLNFDCWLGYNQYRTVVKQFFVLLKDLYGADLPYWFETEFEYGRPHIHLSFRVPLGSDIDRVATAVRAAWKSALSFGGVPWCGQRTGVELVGATAWDAQRVVDYSFKTSRIIGARYARPVGWRLIGYMSRTWDEDVADIPQAELDRQIGERLMNWQPGPVKPYVEAVQPDTYEYVTPLGKLHSPVTAPVTSRIPVFSAVQPSGSTRPPVVRVGSWVIHEGIGECNTPNGRATGLLTLYKFARTVHDTS